MSFRPKLIVLFGARTLGLFKASRYLTRSRLRILCYHGGAIGDENSFNPKLFCSSNTLHARMKWMQDRGFKFVTLDEGVKQQSGAGDKASLRTVVTFDDGWHSTASELLPVLSKRQIPSTLYLCTRSYLQGWPIMNVAARYIIWKAGERSVNVHGWGAEADGVYELHDPDERDRLADAIIAVIERSATERDQACAALERFADLLGVDAATLALDSRRFDYVTQQELLDIAKQGCSIELHGHRHSYPKGNPSKFAEDLRLCEEAIVGQGLPQPKHYCYPSGTYGAEATMTLSEFGVRSATTCTPGLVDKIEGNTRHYLPRFLDGDDVHPLEFEAEMSGFSELMRGMLSLVRRLRTSPKLGLTDPLNGDAWNRHELS